mmetsp:Transcript_10312/g.18825  ORF Transcript_10312/g.18825 Transcript_10312/m.18825 type:complete len:100 (+) Transcript_10312:786-1085(+)
MGRGVDSIFQTVIITQAVTWKAWSNDPKASEDCDSSCRQSRLAEQRGSEPFGYFLSFSTLQYSCFVIMGLKSRMLLVSTSRRTNSHALNTSSDSFNVVG